MYTFAVCPTECPSETGELAGFTVEGSAVVGGAGTTTGRNP